MSSIKRHAIAAILALLPVLLTGCVKSYEDPVGVMTSRSLGSDERLNAARQAQDRMPDDPRRIAALHQMVWDKGFATEERRYAIDQLIEHDEADFRNSLSRRIVLIQNWDTLAYIFELAVERQWTDFTPTLVRQYARPARGTPDADRPERAALEKLNPGRTVEEVVFDVFANADDAATLTQQVGAWELLSRTTPRERLIALLDRAPDKSALVIDLKAAARDLHTLPIDREGVLWLAHLRDPTRQSFWDTARSRVARLTPEQRTNLELRHLPILVQANEDTLSSGRDAALRALRAELAPAEHFLLAPTHDGQAKDYPQRLGDWIDDLSWGDLVTLRYLLHSLRDRAVVASIFEQADADLSDTTTEYGGALVFNDRGGVTAKLFKPTMRQHDLKFIAPQAMIEAVYTGAAHYHFHAQSHRNTQFAGPGRGDIEFASRLNFNCLLFTFVDRDRINVDYYQPGGVVVDLGTLRR